MTLLDPEEINRLYDSGLTIRAIAKQQGVSYGSIQRRIQNPRGRQSATPPPPCGIKVKYNWHLANGEMPCEPCKQANRDATNEHERRTDHNRATRNTYGILRKRHSELFRALRIEAKQQVDRETPEDPQNTRYARAYQRALRKLAKIHQSEFDVIMAAKRKNVTPQRKEGVSGDDPSS